MAKARREAHRRHPRVHDVQAPQLHHHQEQGERPRAHRDEEVLPVGPGATRSTRRPARPSAVRPESSRNHASREEGRSARCHRTWPTWSPPLATGPRGIRRAGAGDVRRDVHARAPAHRERGGRAGRGAGGLHPSLPGPQPLPRRRAVLHVDVPDHRQLREHAPRQAQQAPPRGARRRRPDRRRPARRPTRSSRPTPPPCATGSRTPSRTCPPSSARWWCCETSTTCPTRPSPPSSGSPRRRPRCASTGRARSCGRTCSPAVWRRPPMRCEELADDLAAAADGSVAAGAQRAPPRRALPALPGRARAVPQGPAGHAGHAHRGARAGARACSPTSSPTSRRPASAGPSAR